MKKIPSKPHHRSVPIFILAGGFGTRILEESQFKPKPMLEIGSIPMLVHIMRSYYHYGFNDFVICAGYKSEVIKDYFIKYNLIQNNIELDNRNRSKETPKIVGQHREEERWRVRIIDTGPDSMTGARLKIALDKTNALENCKHFGLTYGDGLTDVNLAKEFEFHLAHGKTGTVLGVKNWARWGELKVSDSNVALSFLEKPSERQGYISGGFFFFKNSFYDYLNDDDQLTLEKKPLNLLASKKELHVFRHHGFWQAMDTMRDKRSLEALWNSGRPPWTHQRQALTTKKAA